MIARAQLFAHAVPSFLLAVIATILFWWDPFGHPAPAPMLHLLMQSSSSGFSQLLPAMDEAAPSKDQLLSEAVKSRNRVNHVQFALPAGRLHTFILSVLDRPAEVEIQKCWITTTHGEVAIVLPLAEMVAATGSVQPGSVEGAVRFNTVQNGAIRNLQYSPKAPIDLTVNSSSTPWSIVLVFVGSWVGAILLSSSLVPHREVMARALRRARAWGEMRPRRSILLAAVLSVTLCTFPVIFCGKSYVSPNNGIRLLYEGLPTVPNSPQEEPENPVGSDIGATMYWHLPASVIEHHAIFHDGEFPLWSRYTWCGVTFFGQFLTMVGDPLHWLTILTGGASWAWDITFIIARLLFALGIGWLVWRAAGDLPVAMVCALSAPYIGFFSYRFCHAATFSVCYAPWLLIAWIEGGRAATHRQAALWAGFLILAEWCQLNSGTAKEAVLLLLFLNGAGLWVLLTERQAWSWRWRRIGIFAWANVLSVLISAPLWLVFLDALGRAWTAYEGAQVYQIQPSLLIGLFDDIFYRQITPAEFLFNPSANFCVLLGVAWALVRIRVLIRDRFFRMGLLAVLPAAGFVFGIVPPWLATSIPLIKNTYHFDDAFSCILFVALFVIAGFGWRECVVRRDHPEWLGDWLGVLALVGLLLAAYFGFTQANHRLARSFLAPGETVAKSAFFGRYVVLLIGALMLLPLAVRAVFRDRVARPIWALVAACLFAALHFRHGMYLPTRFDLYTTNPKTRVDLRAVPSPAIQAIRNATAAEPARTMGLDGVMTPGFNSCLGIETISGPDPLLDRAMLALTVSLRIPRTYMWRQVVSTGGYGKLQRALDFLNVRYLLNDTAEAAPAGARPVGSFDLNLYESETVWPRAFFTDTAAPIHGVDDLVRQIEQGDGRPFAALPAALQARLKLPPRDFARRVVQPAQHYRLTNNTSSFEIDAPAPGLAVLLETNAPGDIIASLDGQPAFCLPVNYAFRGVFVPTPGHHVVKFEYWPAMLDRALNLALLGLLGLVISFGWWCRAGRATPPAPRTESTIAVPASAS